MSKVRINIEKLNQDGTFSGRVAGHGHPLEDARVMGYWTARQGVGEPEATFSFKEIEVEGIGVLLTYFDTEYLAQQAEKLLSEAQYE